MSTLLQEMGQQKTTIWMGCLKLVLCAEAEVVATVTMEKKKIYKVLEREDAAA